MLMKGAACIATLKLYLPQCLCIPLSYLSQSLSTIHCAAPPSVSVTPSETLLSVGDTLTLTCTGGDCVETTNFTFSWLLDGSQVNTSLVTAVNGTTSQLSVTTVTSADFGTYTCQVTSVHGTGTAVSYVKEVGQFSLYKLYISICVEAIFNNTVECTLHYLALS